MNSFRHRTAVITGAASGFGLEVARLAAREGMNVAMADRKAEALERAAHEIRSLGAEVLALQVDVSEAAQVEALGSDVRRRFGAPHVVFNNAGVAAGGLIWETSTDDWNWLLGVNLMGVVHGVRVFTPMMLEAANAHAGYEGHIVNTASMAGLLSIPNMGAYNVSKHAVVALSETLYQDLALISDRVTASVLCPYFVPTAIHESQRERPAAMPGPMQALTRSQRVAQAMTDKAVSAGKVTAAQVAQCVFDALRARRFYIYSHPQALSMVQSRLDDVMQARNPGDPFAGQPGIGEHLRKALRGG